jgi:hypothetical protein
MIASRPPLAAAARPLGRRAFAAAPAPASRRHPSVAVRAGFGEQLINSLTVALKNSPVNEGKKALAVAQAGQVRLASVQACRGPHATCIHQAALLTAPCRSHPHAARSTTRLP